MATPQVRSVMTESIIQSQVEAEELVGIDDAITIRRALLDIVVKAIPCVIGMLCVMLVELINTIFIGHLN